MIEIVNDGPRLASSNYWGSEYEDRGLCYLSINAGALRLLLPREWPDLAEISTAVGAALTRGPWPAQGIADTLSILFDDGSNAPYVLRLSSQQVDRMPPAAETGRELPLVVYAPLPVLELPCIFRLGSIPDLRPWREW